MAEGDAIKVLLVEDNDADAVLFERHVANQRSFDVALERAIGLEDAERALGDNSFDLVFLDLNLGSPLNGMDLLKRMREGGVKTPFIIVTGTGDEQRAAEAMKNGAYDYLVKDTLTPDLIAHAIRGANERFALEQERSAMMARLAELIATDELTGVGNRRRLIERLQDETKRSTRTSRSFALLLIDLDRFKLVNDRHGHQVGDRVLKECATVLAQNVRDVDFVARYGGEEFCVILPETDRWGAILSSGRLRAAVEAAPDPVPTVSIGAAVWQEGYDVDKMLSCADKALYQAKDAGRNQVILYDPE